MFLAPVLLAPVSREPNSPARCHPTRRSIVQKMTTGFPLAVVRFEDPVQFAFIVFINHSSEIPKSRYSSPSMPPVSASVLSFENGVRPVSATRAERMGCHRFGVLAAFVRNTQRVPSRRLDKPGEFPVRSVTQTTFNRNAKLMRRVSKKSASTIRRASACAAST